jgi:group I intron endonuclease
MKKIGIIYCLQNNKTGKQYVGQTTKTLEEKFLMYKYSENSKDKNRDIHKAIKKYGLDSFVIFKLEKCDIDNLFERESYWIKFLNTFETGYNMIERSGHSKKEIEFIVLDFLSGIPQTTLQKKYNICRKTTLNILKERGIDTHLNHKKHFKEEKRQKIIDMYLIGKTTREISSELHTCRKTISKILKENNIKLKESHRDNMNNIIKNERPELIPKIIDLYSNGNNLKQISKIINVNSRHISKILKENNIKVRPGCPNNRKTAT